MTVIKYEEGEHGGGFCGYRVVTTVGSDAAYRQQYYSFNHYGETAAKRLAHALNQKWRADAERILEIRETLAVCTLNTKGRPNNIVRGLRAAIAVDKKYRHGALRMYFTPGFFVKIPGYGKSDKLFRITKWGYKNAYVKAATMYSELHNLDTATSLALLAKQPKPSLFLTYLLPQLRARGYVLTTKRMQEMLDS